MKRKDLILKTKGDVIAEADSFGHGGGFVAVADLTEFKRAVAIGLDLVEISAHADSEQDGIRRAEGSPVWTFSISTPSEEMLMHLLLTSALGAPSLRYSLLTAV